MGGSTICPKCGANVKFSNTTGALTIMQHNESTKRAVVDIGVASIPSNPAIGQSWIISGNEGGAWTSHKNEIALCTDTSATVWSYIIPRMNDILFVTAKNTKYIYSDNNGWIVPNYDIPLTIELEVVKSQFAGLDTQIAYDIRQALLTAYADVFGSNANIYRSNIIDVVEGVEGVRNCKLIQPYSDIFFDSIKIDDLDQDDLLEYTPEYVYFTSDSIIIRILS